MKKRGFMSIGVLIALLLSLSGTIQAQEAQQLVVGWPQDVITLDPDRAYEVYATMVLNGMYDQLVKFIGRIDQVSPHLAEKWEISDDAKVYTFHLRTDVKFSSGNPFTAKDVKWTFERLKNLKSNASFLGENIAGIETPDDATVVITLTTADAAFMSKLASPNFGILDSETVKANGGVADETASTADSAQNWLDHQSAGSGPFILEKFVPDAEIILIRNENYWKGAAPIQRIHFQNIKDPNTQLLMLQKGDIDIAMGLGPEHAALLAGNTDITVLPVTTLTMSFLLMNDDPALAGPIANKDVRQAIKYAIDYKGLHTMAGEGALTPISVIQIGFLGALPPRDPNFTNIEKAKELLAKAGYPDGFETTIDSISYLHDGLNWLTVAEKVAADLATVGIKAEIRPKELTVGLDEYRKGQWPLATAGWSPDFPDANNQLVFLPGEKVGLRANWKTEANPELAELGKKAEVTADNQKRAELLQEIQRKMDENSPFLVLVQHPSRLAFRSNVQGVAWHENYKIEVYNLHK